MTGEASIPSNTLTQMTSVLESPNGVRRPQRMAEGRPRSLSRRGRFDGRRGAAASRLPLSFLRKPQPTLGHSYQQDFIVGKELFIGTTLLWASLWPRQLDVDRIDDRCPTGNLGLDERRERLLSALSFVRNVATQIEQPLACIIVIERLVQCVCELVEGRIRRLLRSEQGEPARYSEVRQTRFP